MIKNGLFICSIASLIILYSVNPMNQQLKWPNLIAGIVMMAIGGYVFHLGKKRDEAKGGNDTCESKKN